MKSDYAGGIRQPALSTAMIWIMSAASGLTVANIYYIQPILAQIAKYYQISQGYAGLLATVTQIGFALGMLLVLPLADMMERRRLILCMLTGAAAFLLLLFFSPCIETAILASLGIGFCSVVPQLLIPFAAQLALPHKRGEVIGSIMSGLLIGILLSRVVSGIISTYMGWQRIYGIAALSMVLLGLALRFLLPENQRESTMTYGDSLRSLAAMICRFPVLRTAVVVGAMAFLAFSAFWTAITFLLQGPPYYLGADGVGLFGLAGIAGALFAPLAGKISDYKGTRFTISLSIGIVIASYVIFSIWEYSLWGLAAGVVLLDLGVQSCNVSNQARIQQLSETARNRITSVYMVSFFLGGSAGSYLAGISFQHFGWTGVCVVGFFSQCIAVCVHLYSK